MYHPDGALSRASQFEVQPGTPNRLPHYMLRFDPATLSIPNPCGVQGHSVHEVIDGHQVLVSRSPHGWSAVCAPDVNGLRVQIIGEPGDAAGLFARHLQVLGTSPASWVRNPLG